MNTLKLYIRNLSKYKVFSIVTIGSFSISLSIVVILASFLVSEYGYDRHIGDLNQIHRVVKSSYDPQIPEEARNLLLEHFPQIESATNYNIHPDPVVYNGENYNARVIHTDEGIFSVLPIEFILGSPIGIFDSRSSVVITESLAQRIFGDNDPMGKILNISHKEDVVVAGVIKDFPAKSTLWGDMLCSSDLKIRYSGNCYNENCVYLYKQLIKLYPNVNPSEVAEKLTSIIPKIREDDESTYSLRPYKNAYFDTTLIRDDLEHANVKLIDLLAWLTGILLVLSVFNYVNLSVAQNLSRLKEFGMKKVLGLNRITLTLHFIYEAFITGAISLAIGVFLSILIKPVFEEMLGKEISINNLFGSPMLILACIVSIVLISTISALYPARIAMQVQAKDLMKRRLTGGQGGLSIRRTLNIIQFAASIAILISLLVITRQVDYVKTKDFGFSTEQLVSIPVHWRVRDKVDLLKNNLSYIPSVVSVCHSHGTPGSIWNSSGNDELGMVSVITSDHTFLETFGMQVIMGRNLLPVESVPTCLINFKAMKQAGWDTFEGKEMFGSRVVGVVNDFHFENLYNEIGALMISHGKDVSHISVRILPTDIQGTIQMLGSAFKEVLPEYEFSYQFYNDYLASMYQQEEKRAASLKIVALITLFISCIGLYGLVDFSTKSRTKEIGIRKVNGAKVSEILTMLNADLVRWVAIAFIIATPIAYYAMNRWLQNFAYHTELSWWIFALAGLMALGVALLTVSFQSWKAARRNPVEALRYE